jgi:ABC-type ATPase with predicted acetyltransferase domain
MWKCWSCGYIIHSKIKPKKCTKCTCDILMDFYEYYMEEREEEENE